MNSFLLGVVSLIGIQALEPPNTTLCDAGYWGIDPGCFLWLVLLLFIIKIWALSKTFFNRISFSGKCYSEYCDRTNGLCPGKICEAGKAILSPSKFNTAYFWSLGWSGDQCNEPVCVWSLCGLDGVCVLPGQCVCTKLYSQVHIAHFVKLYLENVTFLSLGLRNGEWYKNKDRMLLVTSQWTDRRCHHNSSLNIVITSMYSGGTAWHRWGLVNLSHRTWRLKARWPQK